MIGDRHAGIKNWLAIGFFILVFNLVERPMRRWMMLGVLVLVFFIFGFDSQRSDPGATGYGVSTDRSYNINPLGVVSIVLFLVLLVTYPIALRRARAMRQSARAPGEQPEWIDQVPTQDVVIPHIDGGTGLQFHELPARWDTPSPGSSLSVDGPPPKSAPPKTKLYIPTYVGGRKARETIDTGNVEIHDRRAHDPEVDE